jgi:hypothetical protein
VTTDVPARRLFRRLHPRGAPRGAQGAADSVANGYIAWRAACLGVQWAYERWTRWEPADRSVAFALYMVALEHEEHAARIYEREIESTRSTVPVRAGRTYRLQGAA